MRLARYLAILFLLGALTACTSQTQTPTATLAPEPAATSVSCPQYDLVPGPWEGFPHFTLSTDRTRIVAFSIAITGNCGGQIEIAEIPISGCRFEFSGGDGDATISGDATFTSPTDLSGSASIVRSTCASSTTWRGWAAGQSPEETAYEEAPTTIEPTSSTVPTAAPEPMAGIDFPIIIQDITLHLKSARMQESFEFYGQVEEPAHEQDTLLIVIADLIEGEQEGFFDWEVTVLDENGREDIAGISGVGTVDSAGPEITWLFAVDQDSRSFTLSLPDGVSIDLTPLLGEGVAELPVSPIPTAPALPTSPGATAAAVPLPTSTPRVPAREGAATLTPVEPFACPHAHFEDFSSPASVFGNGEADFASWGVVDGEYGIGLLRPDSDARRSSGSGFREEDAIIGADARAATTGSGAFGLFFGQDSAARRFYSFVTDGEGQYALYRFSPESGWDAVQEFLLSPLLHAGGATNRLEVARSGPLIALYANGAPLQTAIFESSNLGRRDSGVIAWSNESAGLDARFDNFSVCPLEEPLPLPVNPLINRQVEWAVDQPALLYFAWPAASEELATAFARAATITFTMDGQIQEGPAEYWGDPQPHPYGSSIAWQAVLPALPAGAHRIEMVISLSEPVSDGFDSDGDGRTDSYGPGVANSGWVELDVRE